MMRFPLQGFLPVHNVRNQNNRTVFVRTAVPIKAKKLSTVTTSDPVFSRFMSLNIAVDAMGGDNAPAA